jgi:hypothetical protein
VALLTVSLYLVLAGQAGQIPVLSADEAAVAEGRRTGKDDSQRQRLARQVPGPGPDMLAEQEHAEQACSSSAKMGWTRANAPKCNAVSWNTNPRIMLATPRSHTGWRARRNTSQTSKAAVSLLLAPLRWHTEAVAVHKLAAMASRIAFSISTAFMSSAVSQPAWP